MYTDHLPDGLVKKGLANRRKFLKLRKDETKDIAANLQLSSRFEVINLRSEPKFSDLCEFVDKLSDFFEIPPLNIHWIPQHNLPQGFFTPYSCSIVLVGPIQSLQEIIAEAFAAHEFGHGMQGELERRIMRNPELAKEYQRMKEFHSDATAATLGSWWGSFEMLKMIEKIQLGKFGTIDSAEDNITTCPLTEPSKTHPSIKSRRMSSIQTILSATRKEFVELIEGEQLDFCQNGVDFVSRVHRERILRIINEAPFHKEPGAKHTYPSNWQFQQTMKYGLPPPEFAFKR